MSLDLVSFFTSKRQLSIFFNFYFSSVHFIGVFYRQESTSLRADPLNLTISTLYAIRGPAAPQARRVQERRIVEFA